MKKSLSPLLKKTALISFAALIATTTLQAKETREAQATTEPSTKTSVTNRSSLINQLMEASQSGDLKKVKSIADQKLDLNTAGPQKLTALMQAAAAGHDNVVDYLLGKKVNLELKNENGDTALAMAVGNEQNAIAEKLIQAGARVDIACGEENETLLMCATRTNAIPLIKEILKKAPGEIVKKNKSGKKAIDIAKEIGTKETVKLLSVRQ